MKGLTKAKLLWLVVATFSTFDLGNMTDDTYGITNGIALRKPWYIQFISSFCMSTDQCHVQMSEWMFLHATFCITIPISRKNKAQSRDYAILVSNEFFVVHSTIDSTVWTDSVKRSDVTRWKKVIYPLPHTSFCETRWLRSVKARLYKTPLPYFIVLWGQGHWVSQNSVKRRDAPWTIFNSYSLKRMLEWPPSTILHWEGDVA